MSLELTETKETELKHKITPVTEYVNNLGVIKTPEVFREASNYLLTIKDFYKVIDEYCDPDIKRAYELHRSLTGKKRVFTDKLAEAERSIKAKLLDYQEIERKRIALEQADALKKQRIAEEKAKEKTKDEIKKGNPEKAQVIMDSIPQVPVVTSEPTKVQGISTREVWSAEIVDKNKIPHKFLIPDMVALNKLAQGCKGNITVPGVKFVMRKILSAGRGQ